MGFKKGTNKSKSIVLWKKHVDSHKTFITLGDWVIFISYLFCKTAKFSFTYTNTYTLQILLFNINGMWENWAFSGSWC